jgi:hypothetical protein
MKVITGNTEKKIYYLRQEMNPDIPFAEQGVLLLCILPSEDGLHNLMVLYKDPTKMTRCH